MKKPVFKVAALLCAFLCAVTLAACTPTPAAPSAAAPSEAAPSAAAPSAAPAESAAAATPHSYSLAEVEKVQIRDPEVAAKIKQVGVTPADLSSGRKLKVGYSQMEVNNTWRIVNNKSIEDAMAATGWEFLYRDAQSSIEKQNRDVIDLLNQGVDYLIIAPYEYEGLAPAVAEAKKKGVPVICSDREIAAVAGEDFVTAILGDFIDTGYKAGQALRNAFGPGVQINVVEITGTAGSSVARDLSNGFKQFMEQDGKMTLIAQADGNFGRKESLTAMQNIIQAYNGKFNAVFGHVDDAAIAAVQALKEAGLTPGRDVKNGQISIVSMCGYKEAFDGILAGDLTATVECTARFGPVLVDIINRLQEGGKVNTRLVMPCQIYDISNAQKLYNEALQ
jgi:galactofuranose transport system substrate-binding protein